MKKAEYEYELQQNPTGKGWSAITYPDTLEKTKVSYDRLVNKYPHIKFRVVRIQTVMSVVPVEELLK